MSDSDSDNLDSSLAELDRDIEEKLGKNPNLSEEDDGNDESSSSDSGEDSEND